MTFLLSGKPSSNLSPHSLDSRVSYRPQTLSFLTRAWLMPWYGHTPLHWESKPLSNSSPPVAWISGSTICPSLSHFLLKLGWCCGMATLHCTGNLHHYTALFEKRAFRKLSEVLNYNQAKKLLSGYLLYLVKVTYVK